MVGFPWLRFVIEASTRRGADSITRTGEFVQISRLAA